MKRFYYVADWGCKNYLFAENILCSAATVWQKGKWRKDTFTFAPTIKRLFIDSGGFGMHKKWGKYPFTVVQYIDYVHHMMDKWPVTEVAVLDYPCEPEVNRTTHSTNMDRIRATVDNAVLCVDADNNIPWVPVIQGFTLKEYLACWELYQDAGIEYDLWAIGSICARKKLGGIRNIVTSLYNKTEQNLHAFGLTLPALRDPQVFFSLQSSDSAVWNWRAMNRDEKENGFWKYNKKIEALFAGFAHQQILEIDNNG